MGADTAVFHIGISLETAHAPEIPSLAWWGMILLAVLVGLGSVRYLRQ